MPWLSIDQAEQYREFGVRNLQISYNNATMSDFDIGQNWYGKAKLEIAGMVEDYCPYVDIDKVIGVVSILSPSLTWEANISAAIEFIMGERTIATNAATLAAKKWLRNEWNFNFRTGPKIANFYHNLRDPHNANHCTIDRHCIRAWLGQAIAPNFSGGIGINWKVYELIKADYMTVAKHYGIFPHQLQATIWYESRRRYGKHNYRMVGL